ncbi:hypothetical protein T459_12546 [Capsicum annuum]|uniref:FRIGIDA-like protein n=1 Tax=Capsicum annuum TaxID=4072 RepID=A0A2G2ZQ46_CAPAN|nr:hypothetical protein T459_12546 [Capsicum annuum]
MSSKGLRKYMIRRISWVTTLRRNVPKALKLSPNPAKLILQSIGIPQAFKNEDINNLMQQSHIKMISGSLKRSSVLMAKIPETIEEMLKKNKVVDTVYFTFIFGLEGRFYPKRLLTSFLHESEVKLLDKIKSLEQMEGSQDSVLTEIIGVKRRYFGGFKSVIQCLGRNQIDHFKFLPEWELSKKVINLESDTGVTGSRPFT